MKASTLKKLFHALLLAIGCGGLLHLISLFVIGVLRQEIRYFNPAYAVDLDQVWPASNNELWFMIGGWLAFFIMVLIIYFLLERHGKK